MFFQCFFNAFPGASRSGVPTDTGARANRHRCARKRANRHRSLTDTGALGDPHPRGDPHRRARNLDLTARTYQNARTASLDTHPHAQNAISRDHLCQHPIGKGGRARNGTARHGTARDTGGLLALPPPSYRRHLVSRPHTASPRLASPARTHARTHERNEYDFPVGLTPQPPMYT